MRRPRKLAQLYQRENYLSSWKITEDTDNRYERAGVCLIQRHDILSHDVLLSIPLFDGDLQAHVKKSKLVSEIEPQLDLTHRV